MMAKIEMKNLMHRNFDIVRLDCERVCWCCFVRWSHSQWPVSYWEMPSSGRVSVATWCQQAVIVLQFECIQQHALGRLVREGLNNVIVYTVSRSCICTIESRAVPEAVSKETPKLQATDFGDISDLL